jgi:hypothetical protein
MPSFATIPLLNCEYLVTAGGIKNAKGKKIYRMGNPFGSYSNIYSIVRLAARADKTIRRS